MKITSLLLFCIVLLMACRKGETYNFDPCEGKVPFKADFQILENAGGFSLPDAWMETDTAFRGGSIRFQTNGEHDSIIWRIAFDNRTFKNQKTVTLLFNTIGEYTVQMISYKKTSGCFTNESAIDTITKKMVLVSTSDSLGYELKKTPLRGLWKGYIIGKESDEFTISLKDWPSNGLYMKNLPKGVLGYSVFWGSGNLVPPKSGFPTYSGYKNFSFEESLGNLETFGSKGRGRLTDYNTIEIKINYPDTTQSNWYNSRGSEYTFIGKRF